MSATITTQFKSSQDKSVARIHNDSCWNIVWLEFKYKLILEGIVYVSWEQEWFT